ncbi:MAG: hypothetical protein U0230_21880 [Polyangiales bacterium]
MIVDASRFPLVRLNLPTAFTLDTLRELTEGYDALFARRAKFMVVCDLRSMASVPDAVVRRSVAEYFNRSDVREAQARYQVGSANIIASPLVRAGVTALLWLWEPPIPLDTVANDEEALKSARKRLRDAGIPFEG